MAPKVLKRPASKADLQKKPAAKRPAANRAAEEPAEEEHVDVAEELKSLKAIIVNLDRRPDRFLRVETMLHKETPWMDFERFPASDGTQNPIPDEDIAVTWSTTRNAHFADYYEWVFDAPGTERHGKPWKWACDTGGEDEEWSFTEDGDDEWSYIHHAGEEKVRTGSVEKLDTKEKFKVRLEFAQRYMEPGLEQKMSGGERGCAHSHLRAWRYAAERSQNTLVLEDDIHFTFDRNADLGQSNGKVFAERLTKALQHLPEGFDVLYLGWSGWRDGHYRRWAKSQGTRPESDQYFRKAEYVWTTVAYVISPAGAKKLLDAAGPINQPVDNFMAWEASQGRLNSFVILDEGDDDGTWAGGIVDQFDFQGDSDIKKSDGGHQGDDEKEFAVTAAE